MSIKPIAEYANAALLAISKLFPPWYSRTTPYSRELSQIEIGFKGTGFELKTAQIMCGLCHLMGRGCTGLSEKEIEISTLTDLGYSALAITTTHPFPPSEAEYVIEFDQTTGQLIKKSTFKGGPIVSNDHQYYGASLCRISPPENK